MFFFLSKILAFLLSPFTFLVLLISWWVLAKNPIKKRKIGLFTIIFLFFFGNEFIVDEFVRNWEIPLRKELNEHYDYAIILGGMANYDAKNNRTQFNSNSDRLLQTLPLIKNKQVSRVLFTGGSGDLHHPENKESLLIKSFLKDAGINDSIFIYESESRNTYENALYSKALLNRFDGEFQKKSILLITSSLHMRRGLDCFKKQGINCTPYATNKISGPRKFEFQYCFLPSISGMGKWESVLHEIVGYWVYWINDYL